VKRAQRITREVEINYDNFYLIGGYRFPINLANSVEKSLKFKYLGKIANDKLLDDFVLSGKSLLELPSDSPAYISVRKILTVVNYL
jgi:hypothetical protein